MPHSVIMPAVYDMKVAILCRLPKRQRNKNNYVTIDEGAPANTNLSKYTILTPMPPFSARRNLSDGS